jgi:beta-glucosidase
VFTGWRQDEKVGLSLGEHVPTGLSISEREDFNHPFQLPEDAFIARCTKLNPNTVVTLACANGVKMDWADRAAGIFAAFYGGQTGADALMQLITGKVNLSAKLPFTIERKEGDSPAAGEDALLTPLKIHADPKELAARVSNHAQFIEGTDHGELFTRDLPYKEGIFVGYRWYDSKNIEPQFPFGYGLSYTTFKFTDLRVSSTGTRQNPGAVVRFKITNTGSRAGTEVAQIYVEDSQPEVPRPKRELKGFARVSLLPGETKEVEIPLDTKAFSYWHPEQKKWVVAKGPFTLALGDSSRGIKETAALDIQ